MKRKRIECIGLDTDQGSIPQPNNLQMDGHCICIRIQDEPLLHKVIDKRTPLIKLIHMDGTVGVPFDRGMIPTSRTTLRDMVKSGCNLRPKDALPAQQYRIEGGKIVKCTVPGKNVLDEVIRSVNFYQWNNGSMDFYACSPPAFENICGSTTTSNRLSWVDSYSSHCIKRSKTSFGHCMEIYSVHGNITIRENCKNSTHTVSLKGVRDVGKAFSAIRDITGDTFVPEPLDANPLHPSDNVFHVHMGVVTAMIGKRVSVMGGCLLERIIDGLDCGVGVMQRLNDENNAVILKVTSWQSVLNYSNGFPRRDDDEDRLGYELDEFEGSDNTITVSSKGAVIIRISWDHPMQWTNRIENSILSYCNSICNIIDDSC